MVGDHDPAFDRIIPKLLKREGGYADHPDDPGGKTRWGITEAVARQHGYTGPMSALPKSSAIAIYRQRYWQEPRLDRLAQRAPRLAEELFDTAVNMGPRVAIGFLQRILNSLDAFGGQEALRVDGLLGPQTLGRLDAVLRHRGTAGEEVLIQGTDALQGARYIAIAEARPASRRFLYGWLANRTRPAPSPTAGNATPCR